MIIDQEMTIAAPVDRVWEFLLDIPSVATCVPGVQSVAPVEGDPNSYIGALKVRVGPIGATLEGKVTLVEKNAEELRAVMEVEAADKRLRSAVNAKMTMNVQAIDDRNTRVLMHSDSSVLGKLGEFGQAIMRRKANQIVEEFGKNVSKKLAE